MLKDTSVLCCESFAFLELGFKVLGAVEVLEVGCRNILLFLKGLY